MPNDPQFERKQYLFDQIGVDLNAPVDRVRDQFAVFMENWRPEIDNALTIRPGQGNGLTLVGGQSPVHSLKRMQDTSTGSLVEAIIAGTGTHAAIVDVALTTPTDLGAGWSGDPLSMAVHQPTESVKPWCYLCDRLKMQKVDVAGNLKQVGLARPALFPTASLATQPAAKIIDPMLVAANWLVGGTAAALAAVPRVNVATRTITAILYEDLLTHTGWANVRPSSMADIGAGMELGVTGANPETFRVQGVYQGSAATTIAGIKYDGAYAWIHLTTPIDQIDVDGMVLLNAAGAHGGPEYVRVLAVERTKVGFTSFLCTPVSATIAAGDPAQVVASLRAYFSGTHVATDPLTATSLQFTVAAGTGSITRNVGAATPIDMSSIAAGVATKPDDIVHISLFADKPELITEVKLYFDIDSGTNNVFAATDHTKNYLLHSIRQNDLVPVTKGTQTALDNAAVQAQRTIIDDQRAQAAGEQAARNSVDMSGNLTNIDRAAAGDRRLTPLGPGPSLVGPNPGNSQDQGSSGQSSYAEVSFRISELLTPGVGRVGSDFSRGLANVAALKVEVVATGAVTVQVDSLTVSGGFGPDVSPAGMPRIYRYRYRDSSTGVVSNWSPASRGGVRPQRQQVLVVGAGTGATEVDKLDFATFGGELLGWSIMGSTVNPGAGNVIGFGDIFAEIDLAAMQPFTEGNIHYQLWPTIGAPISGTGSGTGTLFSLASGAIPPSIAPGTAVKVAGLDYTIYRPISGFAFETIESMGNTGAGVTWEIPAPLLENQRLPIFAGPFHGFYFGLGDSANPWRLYYTNGNDPDTTSDTNWIDIESETLQNMLVTTDGRMFVWSTEYAFAIDPAFTTADSGGALFAWRRIGAVGMPYRFAMCDTGPAAAFMGRTGIHLTSGGQVQVLSEDLRTIFPHEGSAGVAANGLFPPDLSNETNLRLANVRGELMFDYLDTNGARRTLVRRANAAGQAGWRPYLYSVGAQIHYAEEGRKVTSVLLGGVDGKLYRLARNAADAAGAAIVATLQVRSEDGGDAVVSKYVGDYLLDYDTGGATINVTPGNDNFSLTPDGPFALSDATGRRQKRLDIGSPAGSGRRARNVALRITSSVTTLRPILYLWQPSWEPRPETTLLRAHDYHLVGGGGAKFCRGLWIYADTYGVARSATLDFTTDVGTTTTFAIASINHAALTEVYYPIPDGLYITGSRLRPTDAAAWDFEGYRLDAEPAPPLSTEIAQWTDFGEARFVQGVRYEIDTANVPVNMLIRVDEEVVQTTIQAGAHSGPVLANGRAIKAYSFDVPFITHLIRSEPSAACRVWKTEYISEPEPELAYMWWSQQTDGGIDGYKYLGDGQITVRSTDNLVLEFDLDGAGTFAHAAVFYDTVTNTAGQRKALRFRCPVMKFKVIQPRLRCATTAGRVALFKKEFMIEMKGWGAYHVALDGKAIGTPWQNANLLGDLHFESGAKI